jgi:hypothetical protein
VCILFVSGEKVLIEVNSTSTGDQVAAKILKEKYVENSHYLMINAGKHIPTFSVLKRRVN